MKIISCEDCEYLVDLGEGNCACSNVITTDNERVLVLEDYERTDAYLHCKQTGW